MSIRIPETASVLLISFLTGAAEEVMPLEFDVAHMDRSVSPKDDFYRFVNGTWEDQTEIPADQARWGAFNALADNNWIRIHALLDEIAATEAPSGSNARKIGDFYRTALDTAAIDAAGIAPLGPEFARIEAIANLDDLARYLADAHLGIGAALFDSYPYANQSDNADVIMQFSQGGLSLPDREYYFDEQHAEYLPKLMEHIAAMLELAGVEPNQARQDAQLVLALETKLASISLTLVERRDPVKNHHLMSVDAAAALLLHFPLQTYLAALGVPDTETMLDLRQRDFYVGLDELLATEPLRDWKSYLRWQALTAAAPYLAAEFEAENFRFFGTELNGTPEPEPRWQRSARQVDRYLGFALGEIYVARHFPPAVRDRLEAMIALMRSVLEDRIAGLEWMSDATKEKALEKLAAFQVRVGYPPRWRDYTELQIRAHDYFGNVMAGARFDAARNIAKLTKPFDRTEWLRTPQQVNAYYQPSANQLVFLAGILQPPYFDPTADDAVNYGAICGVIGHEITHGFDNRGRKYDARGNLADWWTTQDASNFEARAEKLVEQYNAIEVLPGVFVNGAQTLGENIADLGGASIAFEALERSLIDQDRQLIDDFTPQQRFFIAWTQMWRFKYREDALKKAVASGVHSPGHVRAWGPLVNMPEFYEAFDIREGDPMWRAPADRVKIW